MPKIPGMTLAAGVGATLRGLQTAAGSRGVRHAYLQLVLAIFVIATALEIAGVWGVWEWTRMGERSGAMATVALGLLRIAGIIVVLLAAPVVSVLLANLAFPVLGERVFLAGLQQIAPRRSAELAAKPGLPLTQAVGASLRRLLAYLGATVVVFGLGFVPVAGALAAPWIQAYLTARLLGWELLDPYFDKLGSDYGAQRAFVRDHALTVVGFALPFSFIMAVPLLGPLFFGLAQGATGTLVARVIEPGVE